jgi:hypothetical protein
MRRLLIRAEAEADIEEAYHWYERQRGLGSDFLPCVEDGLEKIQKNPEMYPVVHINVRVSVHVSLKWPPPHSRLMALNSYGVPGVSTRKQWTCLLWPNHQPGVRLLLRRAPSGCRLRQMLSTTNALCCAILASC